MEEDTNLNPQDVQNQAPAPEAETQGRADVANDELQDEPDGDPEAEPSAEQEPALEPVKEDENAGTPGDLA